jgi:hypothetical protein
VLTPELRAILTARKAELLSILVAHQCHAAESGLAAHSGKHALGLCHERKALLSPAESIVATRRRHGIALRIDEATGDLVVGKVGAKAYEPSQPWPSLMRGIEAHLESVAALVMAGWTLKAGFPADRMAA